MRRAVHTPGRRGAVLGDLDVAAGGRALNSLAPQSGLAGAFGGSLRLLAQSCSALTLERIVSAPLLPTFGLLGLGRQLLAAAGHGLAPGLHSRQVAPHLSARAFKLRASARSEHFANLAQLGTELANRVMAQRPIQVLGAGGCLAQV